MNDVVANKVFPLIKKLSYHDQSSFSRYMKDAIYQVPTPQILEKVVTGIENLDWETNRDVGDLYEYLLSKLSTSGTNGQFRTPRHIIDMMVELVDPNPQDTIIDPACGSRVIIMITADSNDGDWLSSPLLENKNMDWCAF